MMMKTMGMSTKIIIWADRPKFYANKKSYDEGQYNYGDTQNNPNRQNYNTPTHQLNKRQSVNPPPSHQANTKRVNLNAPNQQSYSKRVQTTQQLASKKHFG